MILTTERKKLLLLQGTFCVDDAVLEESIPTLYRHHTDGENTCQDLCISLDQPVLSVSPSSAEGTYTVGTFQEQHLVVKHVGAGPAKHIQ